MIKTLILALSLVGFVASAEEMTSPRATEETSFAASASQSEQAPSHEMAKKKGKKSKKKGKKKNHAY